MDSLNPLQEVNVKSAGFISVIKAEKEWIDRARRNPAHFLTYMTGGKLRPAKHHLEWLAAMFDPKVKRLLIVAPRESAKTTIVVYTMAWLIGRVPSLTNIISSVAAKQTTDRLDMIRSLIETPQYKNTFPHLQVDNNRPNNANELSVWSTKWRIDPASDDPGNMTYAAYRSLLPAYGDLKNPTIYAAGITSSKIIGRRFNGIALVDDPHDSKNSATEDQRAKVDKMFVENILGGVQHSAKVVVITTRWAVTDQAGRLKSRKSADGDNVWRVIETSAIKEDGTSYWPEYWPLHKLQEKRDEVGDIMFETMYLNNPLGMSSGMFRIDQLRKDLPDPMPVLDRILISVDLARSKTASADWTVLAAVAKDSAKPYNYYILDLLRVKVNFNEALSLISQFADDIQGRYTRIDGILFEKQGMQLVYSEELKNRRPDLPIIEVPIKGDKGARLGGVAVKAQRGALYINQSMPTYSALVSELVGFPSAEHDDIVDALSLPLQQSNWGGGAGAGIIMAKSDKML